MSTESGSTRAGRPPSGQTRSTTLDDARRDFRAARQRLARQVRARRLWEALVLALLAAGLGLIVGLAWMDARLFDALAVQAGVEMILGGVALGVMALLTALALPARAAWVVARVERDEPTLDGLVASALQLEDGSASAAERASPALVARLFRRATAILDANPPLARQQTRRAGRAQRAALVPVALVALVLMLGPDGWRHGLGLLLVADPDSVENPYSLTVEPGDAARLAGEDIAIHARPEGFDADQVVLELRAGPDESWRRVPMQRDATPGGSSAPRFDTNLLELAESFEYRVIADRLRSPIHAVEVTPRPQVAGIDLTYHYPPSTAAPSRKVVDGGDITAVRGTRVELHVRPDRAVASARLTLHDGSSVELTARGDTWVGELTLTDDGSYRVDLAASEALPLAPASREFAIAALADGLPEIAIERPGRDVKVSAIEEVSIAVNASDDVAVRTLELVVSVNGAEETVIALPAGERASAPIHQLLLEEVSLTPGDLIAYHARASDADQPGRTVHTDIYFLEVRPFERQFRRARSGGGGGGGGGQRGGDAMLAAQQRAVVIALFKLVRDHERLGKDTVTEQVTTIGTGQARIRDRVEAIARRLGARAVVTMEPGYRQMAEELPKAARAMTEVEAALAEGEVTDALPRARKALAHLQRADAAFREVQVAQSQRGGGGGGQSRQSDELANLFKLEMDRFRSQYAQVNRNRPGQRTRPEIDEAIARLEALARRQEREIQARRPDGRGGQGGSQAALAAEVEKLLRELERLTRERPDPSIREARQRLADAAEAMRRSGARQGSNRQSGQGQGQSSQGQSGQGQSGQGRSGQGQSGQGQSGQGQSEAGQASNGQSGSDRAGPTGAANAQREALDALRAAQRALERAGPSRLAGSLVAARNAADEALERQRAMAQHSAELGNADDEAIKGEEAARADALRRDELVQEGEALAQAVGEMTQRMREAARRAGEVGAEVQKPLQDAATALRDGEVGAQVARASDATVGGLGSEYLLPIQRRLGETLRTVRESLDSAATAAQAAVRDPAAEARRRLAAATRELAEQRRAVALADAQGANREGRDGGSRSAGSQAARRDAGSENGQAGEGAGNRTGQGQGGQNQSGQGQTGQGQTGQGQTGQGQAGQGGGRGGSDSRGQAASGAGIARSGGDGGAGGPIGPGGGRFGGTWRDGARGNADFTGIREGLRSSVAALRDTLDVIGPTSAAAGDISALVSDLEALQEAPESAIARRFELTLTALQDIEHRLREGAPADRGDGVPAPPPATVRGTQKTLVREYFRALGEDGS